PTFTTQPPPTSTLFPYTTLFRSKNRTTVMLHCFRGAAQIVFPEKAAQEFAVRCQSHSPIPRQRHRGRGKNGRHRPHGPASSQKIDRKSTRLNSSHSQISYAVFCL